MPPLRELDFIRTHIEVLTLRTRRKAQQTVLAVLSKLGTPEANAAAPGHPEHSGGERGPAGLLADGRRRGVAQPWLTGDLVPSPGLAISQLSKTVHTSIE